jgi:hypothetical protein
VQGVFSDHWNSLVQRARWHFPVTLLIHSAPIRKPAQARTRAALPGTHGLAGSTLSSPAKMTCACQRNRKAIWSSRDGKLPTTDSRKRSRRNRRRNRNLYNLCTLCSLGSRRSRSRGLP